MTIDVTDDDITRAKRAIVALSEIAMVAMVAVKQDEPLDMKRDRLALIKLVRAVEAHHNEKH
jgi:hypothetical protein